MDDSSDDFDPNENLERDLHRKQLKLLENSEKREVEARGMAEQQLALQRAQTASQQAMARLHERTTAANENAAKAATKNAQTNRVSAKAKVRSSRALAKLADQFERLVDLAEVAMAAMIQAQAPADPAHAADRTES